MSALVAVLGVLAFAGCTPGIVVPVNYHVIRGTVGEELTPQTRLPCESPEVLAPAKIDEGDLPPGLMLAPNGVILGKPVEAGSWHVMIRSARLQCPDKVHPDQWRTLHFEIAKH